MGFLFLDSSVTCQTSMAGNIQYPLWSSDPNTEGAYDIWRGINMDRWLEWMMIVGW